MEYTINGLSMAIYTYQGVNSRRYRPTYRIREAATSHHDCHDEFTLIFMFFFLPLCIAESYGVNVIMSSLRQNVIARESMLYYLVLLCKFISTIARWLGSLEKVKERNRNHAPGSVTIMYIFGDHGHCKKCTWPTCTASYAAPIWKINTCRGLRCLCDRTSCL